MAHAHDWVSWHAPRDLIAPDTGGGLGQGVSRGRTSLFRDSNEQSDCSGGWQTDLSLLLFSLPLLLHPTMISLQTLSERQRWLSEEGGTLAVEPAPAAVGGTDVGRPALGRGSELTNANYDAKQLAKYVSPCRIRLLRGRFYGQREVRLSERAHLKAIDAK